MIPWKRLRDYPAYPGWTMAFVAFMSFALTFGPAGATMPLIYGAVIDDFGWSLTDTSLFYTYKSLAAAVTMLFLVGPLISRYGLRRIMVSAFAVTAIGMMALLLVESRPVYYLAGAIQGVGLAMVAGAANMLVSRWFSRNQGMALGFALAGMSTGSAVFPMLAAALIEWIGWRGAMASLSLLIWLVALPLYLWKARENPAGEDLTPELDDISAESPAAALAGDRQVSSDSKVSGVPGANELVRAPAFWRIALALFFIAIADMAMVQHMPLLLAEEKGFDASLGAFALTVMFAFGVAGKIIAGRFYDRFSVKGMRIWCLFVAASIMLFLPVAGLITLILFAAVRGLAHGGLVPKPAVLAKHCFGSRQMEVALPLLLGVWMVGAGIGPIALALIFDATGSYGYGLPLLATLCLVATGLLGYARSGKGVRAHSCPDVR